MNTKPKVIDLSYLEGEYTLKETPDYLTRIEYSSDDKHRYSDVIKVKDYVEIRGAKHLFNGIYYVEKISHNIKKGKYISSFTLRKSSL